MTTETFDHRLTRLERSNRRWRAGFVAIAVALVALVSVGAVRGGGRAAEFDEIVCRKLIVENEAGQLRMRELVEPGAPAGEIADQIA